MSKPEETTPTPATPVRELTEAEKFAEEWAAGVPPYPGPRKRRRKALRVEVSQRTFDAAKANPGELKIITRDAHGNAVIERPGRRMTEAEMVAHNERILRSKQGLDPDRRRQDPGPEPRDQHWTEIRQWNGETRYVRDDGSRNPYVTHVYDIFDVLRENDR